MDKPQNKTSHTGIIMNNAYLYQHCLITACIDNSRTNKFRTAIQFFLKLSYYNIHVISLKHCQCNPSFFSYFLKHRSMSRPIVVCIRRGKVHVTSCFFGITRFFDTGSTKYTFRIGWQSCKRSDKHVISFQYLKLYACSIYRNNSQVPNLLNRPFTSTPKSEC